MPGPDCRRGGPPDFYRAQARREIGGDFRRPTNSGRCRRWP